MVLVHFLCEKLFAGTEKGEQAYTGGLLAYGSMLAVVLGLYGTACRRAKHKTPARAIAREEHILGGICSQR